jgi:hypothetical protein
MPHVPQLFGSSPSVAHVPLQATWPPGQLELHAELPQTCSAEHAFVHAPQ